jgi:hypothetical protein
MRMFLVTALLVGCVAPVPPGTRTTPRPATASSSAGPSASDTDSDDDEECHEEAPTGSLLIRTYCRDKIERDGNRKEVQEWIEKPRSLPGGAN